MAKNTLLGVINSICTEIKLVIQMTRSNLVGANEHGRKLFLCVLYGESITEERYSRKWSVKYRKFSNGSLDVMRIFFTSDFFIHYTWRRIRIVDATISRHKFEYISAIINTLYCNYMTTKEKKYVNFITDVVIKVKIRL